MHSSELSIQTVGLEAHTVGQRGFVSFGWAFTSKVTKNFSVMQARVLLKQIKIIDQTNHSYISCI